MVGKFTRLLRVLRTPRDAPAGRAGLPIAALYDASQEATLIIDAATGNVVDANPASLELLRRPRERLVGGPWLAAFSASSVLALTRLESGVHGRGIAGPQRAVLRDSTLEVEVSLSLVRAPPSTYLLAHLAGPSGAPAVAGSIEGDASAVLAGSADGFVVTDPAFEILYANAAFAERVGLRTAAEVVGHSLAEWVDFVQEDLESLARQMQSREAVKTVSTRLRPAGGGETRSVELTAVAVPDEPQRCFGFWVRLPELAGPGVGLAPPEAAAPSGRTPES